MSPSLPSLPSVSARRTRVLIVDDHDLVRRGAKALLEPTSDFEVCAEAATAAEGLEAAERHRPDVILLDMSLRGGSGLELLRTLHSRCPESRVLVLSIHDELLYAERALRGGAHGYVMKEEAGEELIRALRKVAAGQIHVSESVAELLMRRVSSKHPVKSGSPIEQLSDRELEVFEYIGRGLATRDIAALLSLSTKTIETYRTNIRIKLGLRTGAEVNRHAVIWHESR